MTIFWILFSVFIKIRLDIIIYALNYTATIKQHKTYAGTCFLISMDLRYLPKLILG